MKKRVLKTVPHFETEQEEQAFWAKHDSSKFIDWEKAEKVELSKLKPSSSDGKPKK